jgi:predicted metal-dependent phosphoesterase TrpH
VDAIETFNARSLLSAMNERAAALAREVELPAVIGSDAHSYGEVGRATMRMPACADAEQFLENLPMAELRPRRSSPLVHLASRWAALMHRLQ